MLPNVIKCAQNLDFFAQISNVYGPVFKSLSEYQNGMFKNVRNPDQKSRFRMPFEILAVQKQDF